MRSKFILTALVFFLVSVAWASVTVTHTETGLQFDLPESWEIEQDGNLLTAASPDQSVILMFYVGKADDAADLLENIADELDGIIDEPEITSDDVEEAEINGLLQVFIEGTGYYGDDEVDFDLTMVFGGNRTMSIIALGDIDGMQDTIDRIYSSIRD